MSEAACVGENVEVECSSEAEAVNSPEGYVLVCPSGAKNSIGRDEAEHERMSLQFEECCDVEETSSLRTLEINSSGDRSMENQTKQIAVSYTPGLSGDKSATEEALTASRQRSISNVKSGLGNVTSGTINENKSQPEAESPARKADLGQSLDSHLAQNEFNTVDKASKKTDSNSANVTVLSKLTQEVQRRTIERDDYRRKLEDAEKKLGILQESYDALKSSHDDESIARAMEQMKNKLTQTSLQLHERNRMVTNQESQIRTLNNQIMSLKKVVSITKELLDVRNDEVKHLQAEVDDMEIRISEERARHDTMIAKMDKAVRLNGELKKEYEIQLRLFNSLREKYEEKVNMLSMEKRALESATSNSTSN